MHVEVRAMHLLASFVGFGCSLSRKNAKNRLQGQRKGSGKTFFEL